MYFYIKYMNTPNHFEILKKGFRSLRLDFEFIMKWPDYNKNRNLVRVGAV